MNFVAILSFIVCDFEEWNQLLWIEIVHEHPLEFIYGLIAFFFSIHPLIAFSFHVIFLRFHVLNCIFLFVLCINWAIA